MVIISNYFYDSHWLNFKNYRFWIYFIGMGLLFGFISILWFKQKDKEDLINDNKTKEFQEHINNIDKYRESRHKEENKNAESTNVN